MMTIGKRIRQARKTLGLSQIALSERCGWLAQQGRVSHYERGSRNPSRGDMAKLAAALGVSHFWLEFGREPASDLPQETDSAIQTQYREFPVVTWEHLSTWVEKPDERLIAARCVMAIAAQNPFMSAKAFSVIVEGDAMISHTPAERSLYPGDTVVIDPELTPRTNEIVLVQINNDLKLRKLIQDGNQQLLKAQNPQYPLLAVDENTTILGTVAFMSAFLVERTY